jgi:hypothetical protein
MARKRSLKDVAADPSVEKIKVVSEETPTVEEVKAPGARKNKAGAVRKRSLKDAAADQLVEKSKVVREEPAAPAEAAPVMPAAAAVPFAVEPTPAELAEERTDTPLFTAPPSFCNESSKALEGGKKGRPPVMWIAISLLIGLFAGFFFGVGQAIGPANMAFILIGLAGGCFLGRCFKVS